MKRKIKILFSLVLATVLLNACVFTPRTPEPDTTETAAATQMTAEQTEETTEPQTTAPQIQAPESLEALLKKNGADTQSLAELDCRQLVTVSVAGTEAQICFYWLDNNQWLQKDDLTCDGYVGLKGATENKREGDRATPKGLFSISDAFYINEAPQTALNTFRITRDTYWVDDPDSQYYNKRVEGTENKDWVSAEHMIDYSTAYEYGFVIDYNVQATANAGSAIFFHVGYAETAGCIATERENVLKLLAALDETCNPYILIV